jgi:ankyrin repeat protein
MNDDVGAERGTHDEGVKGGEEVDGRALLFDALNQELNLDVIRSIVEAHPESVECDPNPQTNGGWCSALTMVIWAAGDYEEVLYIATRNPEAAKVRDHLGRLPLHHAVMYRARLPVIRMLVEMYPQALQEPIHDTSGHLPLHCAFLNGYSEFGNNDDDDDDDNYDIISVARLQRADVLAYLLEQNPAAARVRTAKGHLPLHLAFVNDDGEPWLDDDDDNAAPPHFVDPDAIDEEVSVEVLAALLGAWPDAAMQTDHRGRVPLHLACQSPKTRPHVLRHLIEACPTSLRRRDVEDGNLPIHHAIVSGMPVGSISVLAEAWPASVAEPSDEGHSALHLHLLTILNRREEAIQMVRLLVSHCPLVVRKEGGKGGFGMEGRLLPLHLAVAMDAPLDVIRYLAMKCFNALTVKTANVWLPLHLAAQRSSSVNVVRFLVDECPQSVRETTDERLLALHVAARDSSKRAIAVFLHQTWPEAIREQSTMGCTPVHFAATRSGNVGVRLVRYFLDHWSRAVEETTWTTGSLPLHFAASGEASPDAVRLLVERGPKALLLVPRHDDGTLPLHGAASRDYDPSAFEVVRYLADQAPEALPVADHRGFLPLHEAVSTSRGPFRSHFWKCRMPVVRHLVKALPQALEVKDGSGRIPLLVAAEADAPLEVLLHLLTSGPPSLGGYGRLRSRSPRRSKRPRLS